MDERTGLPIVGMVGGGHVARMTHQAAISLGQTLRVLAAPGEDRDGVAAPQVQVGDHTDLAVLREFARGCDILTFGRQDILVKQVETLVAGGVAVAPGPDALALAQNRLAMRERLARLSLAVTDETIPEGRRLVATVARSPFGQVAVYPLAEACRSELRRPEVIVPPPGLTEGRAAAIQRVAVDLAAELTMVGLLTIKLVDTGAGLLIHRLAIRPHGSGCWTIEGSRTSQFEQHLRAVLDYPLGQTGLTAPVVSTAQVPAGSPCGMSLDERLHHLFAADPGARVHLYGAAARADGVIGHVTTLGEDHDVVRTRTARAASWLSTGTDPSGAAAIKS